MAREMKDSGISWIGDLPSAWATMPTKYNFTLVAGATPDSHNPDLWDGDVNWITPADFKTEDVYVKEGSRKLSEIGFKSCSTTMIPAGSIIFSKRAPIGTVAINTTELCTNQGCLGLVKKSRGLDNKYYYYVLSIYPEVFNLFGSGTTFKEISATAFGEVSLPFPPINEQHRISAYLDAKCSEIDALTADIQSQIDTLEQYKRSVIAEAVTKGLDKNEEMVDSGIPWIGKIPATWSTDKIKYHLLRTETRNRSELPVLSVYREYGVIPKDSRNDNHNVTSEDTSKYKYVRPGFLVINKMKAWQGSMGVSKYEGIVSPAYFIYRFTDNMLNKWYIHYLLRNCYKDEFRRISGGIREGQWDLPDDGFENEYIPIPPKEVQEKIVDYIKFIAEKIDKVVTDKQHQLALLDSYKKSLIYEYVTGKKEVPSTWNA